MSDKKPDENYYRRLVFKFFEREKSTRYILKQIPRSRSWLFKWKQRFAEQGWQALNHSSQRPKNSPQEYRPKTRDLILKLRQRMEKSEVGLCGARILQAYLVRHRTVKRIPSVSTIKRWLRDAGCFASNEDQKRKVYYPRMKFSAPVLSVACDWVARYIKGGEKVFVYHTIDLKTHALCQSIEKNKTTAVACQHLLKCLTEMGLIDYLQLDNDAAFTGLGMKPRIFGQFVRTALYFGIELVFIPPREPKRNGVVERVNGLWARAFWDRNHFACIEEVKRKSGKFLKWYLDYTPPSLEGQSVEQASRKTRHRKLSKKECQELPEKLPLTVGRIHYYRRVDESGMIEVLKEKIKISKTLRGEYVIATLDLEEQTLTINYRRSEKSKAKILKKLDYKIKEPIVKLKSKYRRGKKKRVEIIEII